MELSEYFTLRSRGLLHALPASRYVGINATYRDWYRALPVSWNDGRHFVVKVTQRPDTTTPLPFQALESNNFYSLQPEMQRSAESSLQATDFLSSRLGQPVVSDSPFYELIKQVRYAQRNFPFGLAILKLGDYEALRKSGSSVKEVSAECYLPAEDSLEKEAWFHHLPDIEDENYAVVLRLNQVVTANTFIPRDSIDLDKVYPLSERGAQILQIENPNILLAGAGPMFENSFVRPVLDSRIKVERRHNAEQLADLVPGKHSKDVPEIASQLMIAWELRQNRDAAVSPNPNCTSFWDYLLDYDRTGEKTLAILNNERGYLQDLRLIIGRYLKRTRLASGQLSEDELTQIIGVWNKFADDDQFDTNAFKLLVAKSPKNLVDAIRRVSESLAIKEKIQPLIVGFMYLRLRRELGDLEQELTLRKLKEYIKQADKYNSELCLALYALGLLFPFKTFVELYDENAESGKNVTASMLNPIDSENQLERKSETLDELPPSAPLQIGIPYNL